jgi:hypothetical protein
MMDAPSRGLGHRVLEAAQRRSRQEHRLVAWRHEHVLRQRYGIGSLERLDLSKCVRELVARADVIDAVAQLDHVPGLDARELHVEGALQRVELNRRIVGGRLAGLHRLVDAAVAAVDARGA